MKKLKLNLQNMEGAEVLTREQLKKVVGGELGSADSCNVYCGDGSGYTCSGQCSSCEDAGNGKNPNVKGGDKLCFA